MAQMTKKNYLRVVLFTLGFLFAVLGLAGLAATNTVQVAGEYTIIYPSVYKAVMLNLGFFNFVAALALAGFAAYSLEAFLTDTADWLGVMSTGKIILLIAIPVALALVSLFGGAYNVQDFTHVTLPAAEFEAVKGSNLDNLFTSSFQADSLYNVAKGVK